MDIPDEMTARVLEERGGTLQKSRLRVPEPGRDQVLIEVRACSVCRTDLHLVDGELTGAAVLVPGC